MLHWRKTDKSTLYAPFLDEVERFFSTPTMAPYDFYVTEGFRSVERSRIGYATYMAGQGPRYAPPYKSAHNYGLAIDVVLDSSDMVGLQPSWNVKLAGWIRLKAALINHPTLSHLWSIGDWPHIEFKAWKALVHYGQGVFYKGDLKYLDVWKERPPLHVA